MNQIGSKMQEFTVIAQILKFCEPRDGRKNSTALLIGYVCRKMHEDNTATARKCL